MWKAFVVPAALMVSAAAHGQESGRVRRPPPSAAEAARIASDMAMNDSLLQKGDIVVTDRGFFVFRGPAADGVTNEFARVPDPGLPANQPGHATAKQRSDGRRAN
jgi:hypothetical protein